MYLFSSKDVTPLEGQTLTCDDLNVDGTSLADYTYRHTVGGVTSGITEAIVLGSGASIHFQYDNSQIQNCNILTNGSIANPIIPNPGNQGVGLSNDRNMVANGDVGIFCDGPENNYIHNVTVIGFDTGIAGAACSRWRVDSALIDADVGFLAQSLKSPMFLTNIKFFPVMQKNSPGAGDTSQGITDIADDGTAYHRCKITTSSAIGAQDGDWVDVASQDKNPTSEGVISCFGLFKAINVSSNTLALDGSTYNTGVFLTTRGTWLQGSQILNAESVAGVGQGQLICPSGCTDGSMFMAGTLQAGGISAGGTGFTVGGSSNGTALNVPLTCAAGCGTGISQQAIATITVTSGVVTNVVITSKGLGYSTSTTLNAGTTLNAAGTGTNVVGDVLTVLGGTSSTAAQITVDAVAGGVITGWHISRAGNYTSIPANPVATSSSGAGTGAKFDIGWVLSGAMGHQAASGPSYVGAVSPR